MDWHGPLGLPKRQPEPGEWLSWVALAALAVLAVVAIRAGMGLP